MTRAEAGEDVPIQIGFAPGRMRTAVARNRIKRLLREVYRIHQYVLVDLFSHSDRVLVVMVLYRGRPEQASVCIPHDLPAAMERVAEQLRSGRGAS